MRQLIVGTHYGGPVGPQGKKGHQQGITRKQYDIAYYYFHRISAVQISFTPALCGMAEAGYSSQGSLTQENRASVAGSARQCVRHRAGRGNSL